MLTWVAYALIVAVVVVIAGMCIEGALVRLHVPTRLVWVAVIALALSLAATAGSRHPRLPRWGHAAIESTPDSSPTAEQRIAVTEMDGATATAVSPPSSLAAQSMSPDSATSGADGFIFLVWMLSTAACVTVLAVSAMRVQLMRRGWKPSAVSGVPVLVSHDVGPAVIGLVFHGIVVPSWVEELSDEAKRLVMTHEREHVRAGDPMLLWGTSLLVALMPWNIPLWFALRRLRHAIEMDCDARVLRARPDARAYCALLLDVGERTLAGVAPIAALAEPSTLLERRIEAMTSARVTGWRVPVMALGAAGLVLLACRAPTPTEAPQSRLAMVVRELTDLLANESVRNTLTDGQRNSLLRAVAKVPQEQSAQHELQSEREQLLQLAMQEREQRRMVRAMESRDLQPPQGQRYLQAPRDVPRGERPSTTRDTLAELGAWFSVPREVFPPSSGERLSPSPQGNPPPSRDSVQEARERFQSASERLQNANEAMQSASEAMQNASRKFHASGEQRQPRTSRQPYQLSPGAFQASREAYQASRAGFGNLGSMERWSKELQRPGAITDSVISAAYPQLRGRQDTTPALVVVVLDTMGNVMRHTSRIGAQYHGDVATLLQTIGIDTLSARTRMLGAFTKPRHVNVVTVVEGAGPVHGQTSLGGKILEPNE